MINRDIRWFASKSSPHAGIKLIVDDAHVALVKRVRRQLGTGEGVRKAA